MASYKIERTDSAENDLKEIALFIAIRNSIEIAYKLVDEIEQAIDKLKTLPFYGSPEKFAYVKKQGYRFIVVKNYLIHYHIDELQSTIFIDRIRYGAIAPQNQI